MQCPECGYMLSAFEKDCPRCKALEGRRPAGRTITLPPRQAPAPVAGGPQYHVSLCPQCGAGLTPGLQLCTACGTKFPAPVAAPPGAVQPHHSVAQYPAPQYPAPQYPAAQPPPQGPTAQNQGPAAQVVIYNNVLPPAQPPGYPGTYGDVVQMPPGAHGVAGAVIAAFFITGVGQMVNRQGAKGAVLLLAAVLFAWPTAFVAPGVLWLLAFIDAICIANRLNRGEPVRPWQWF